MCPILDVSTVQLGTVEEADRSQDMNDRGIAADQPTNLDVIK